MSAHYSISGQIFLKNSADVRELIQQLVDRLDEDGVAIEHQGQQDGDAVTLTLNYDSTTTIHTLPEMELILQQLEPHCTTGSILTVGDGMESWDVAMGNPEQQAQAKSEAALANIQEATKDLNHGDRLRAFTLLQGLLLATIDELDGKTA